MRALEAALLPLFEVARRAIAAPLLGCAVEALRCPRRAWKARVHGGAHIDEVHQDVEGDAFDGWLNVTTPCPLLVATPPPAHQPKRAAATLIHRPCPPDRGPCH